MIADNDKDGGARSPHSSSLELQPVPQRRGSTSESCSVGSIGSGGGGATAAAVSSGRVVPGASSFATRVSAIRRWRAASSLLSSSAHSRNINTSSRHGSTGEGRRASDLADVDEAGGYDSDEDDDETADRKRVYRSVRDAGRYSDGISAVEVWVLDTAARRLVRPDGGWWRSPDFDTSADAAREALSRLEEEERQDFVAADPLLPGTGLAGKLWAESSSSNMAGGGLAKRSSARGENAVANVSIIEEEDEGNDEEEGGVAPAVSKGGKRNLFEGMSDSDSEDEFDEEQVGKVATAFERRGGGGGDVGKPVTRPRSDSAGESTGNRRRSSATSHEEGGRALGFIRRSSTTSTGEEGNQSRPSLQRGPSIMDQLRTRPDFRRSMMMESKRINKSSARRGLSSRNIKFLEKLGPVVSQPLVNWRNLASLSSDPDQPTFLRLSLLEEAGFRQAAGVPFDCRGTKGIVVYLARSDVDKKRLGANANESYLQAAADAVGAAVALVSPRKKSVESREERRKRMEGTVAYDPEDANKDGKGQWEGDPSNSRVGRGANWVRTWGSKCRGGDLQPPPPATNSQSLLTFVGACSTLLLLGYISELISEGSGGRYGLVLGPFGALMMLQYGLVMAPASQPRSAIMGQLVSLTVALCFSYLSEEQVPVYVRVALATSTAVAAMAKLAVVHPPAAAAAAVVSGGVGEQDGWILIPLFLLGNIIAIGTATVINNVSDKRQYPTFWGIRGPADWTANFCSVKPIEPYRPKAWDEYLSSDEEDGVDNSGRGKGGWKVEPGDGGEIQGDGSREECGTGSMKSVGSTT